MREGVTDVFGYPGGAILPAYDAMLRATRSATSSCGTSRARRTWRDGYARASGKVGVAIATSGPGATNMVTGIATAMMDSSPIVCITGQVGSKLIGSDAFQETDITGITLPITKHNYLVTRAEDVAPAVREAFAVAQSGRPGPVLVDITKDAQQGQLRGRLGRGRAGSAPRRCDDALPGDGDVRDAIELINAAERPLILAGHGVMLSGAERRCCALAERAQIPIAVTLLGIGGVAGVASAEPRHDGHARRSLGQQRDSGSRPADRARHAASTTASPATSRPTRATPRRFTSTSTAPS